MLLDEYDLYLNARREQRDLTLTLDEVHRLVDMYTTEVSTQMADWNAESQEAPLLNLESFVTHVLGRYRRPGPAMDAAVMALADRSVALQVNHTHIQHTANPHLSSLAYYWTRWNHHPLQHADAGVARARLDADCRVTSFNSAAFRPSSSNPNRRSVLARRLAQAVTMGGGNELVDTHSVPFTAGNARCTTRAPPPPPSNSSCLFRFNVDTRNLGTVYPQ